MESSASYIELTALAAVPRWRAVSEGSFLLHKSQSLQTVGITATAEVGTQTDFEEEKTFRGLVKEKAYKATMAMQDQLLINRYAARS